MKTERPSSKWVPVIMGSVALLMVANWVMAVARFQVNGVMWDQWEIYTPLFEESGLLSIFIRQHGPHRQGLAFIFTSWVMDWSQWDSRVESLWIVAQLAFSALLALRLKLKLAGQLRFRDTWIPIAILTLMQYEHVILIGESSHSVFPLLLMLLVANLWQAKQTPWRYGALGGLAILLTFTGNGMFGGGILAGILAIEAGLAVRRKGWRRAAWPALASGLAWLGLIWFLIGFVVDAGSEGYAFPHEPWTDYPRFMALTLAGRMGWTDPSGGVLLTGTILLVVSGAVVWLALIKFWRGQDERVEKVVLFFIGSVLVFVGLASIGRVHLDPKLAIASRYMPLLVLLWLALDAAAGTWSKKSAAGVATALGWAMALGPWLYLPDRPVRDWPGTLGLTDNNLVDLRGFMTKKMAWLEAFEQTGHWQEAERRVPGGLHPHPADSGFDWKIAWLRQHERSFLAQPETPRAWLSWTPDQAVTWLNPLRGGRDRRITDQANVLLRPTSDRFVNVRMGSYQRAAGSDIAATLELGAQRGRVTLADLAEGLSLPVVAGSQMLILDAVELAYPRLMAPTLTAEPAYAEWQWVESEARWMPVRRLEIVAGFYGWENERSHGWTTQVLELAVQATQVSYLNVSIESRFEAVDSGPVVLEFDGRQWDLPASDAGWQISVAIPADRERRAVRFINAAGARIPADLGQSDDQRSLALRIDVLSVDSEADFSTLK